ncbi:hypothetical protein PR002_g2476 [Phytophthora rubi]|uniref:Uncharacterized protein n=1 Tax=Phytophthora rubi TaxID=129364 RepID=A0A6A3NP21_9STRA|nr:hypothetical protein PR002_g2476 [Phytophthora rubi]
MESSSRFVTLLHGTGGYVKVAGDAPVQVEFTAEGCPEHHTTFRLEGSIFWAMAKYCLERRTAGQSSMNFSSPKDDSPLAEIFLRETIEYNGRIWMGAFIKCARRLMAYPVPPVPRSNLLSVIAETSFAVFCTSGVCRVSSSDPDRLTQAQLGTVPTILKAS